MAAPPAWYPSPWTTERVRYMPAAASPFSAPHPLSRGATARTANAVRAVFVPATAPAKRPPTRSANGGLPPGAVPKRLHRLAQLCLLRLGLQQLLQRRQSPQPSVRGGEYRPGVQAAANVVAGHQGVHIGVVKEQPARRPHAQQHPEPAEVPVPHLPQGGCQEHRQHGPSPNRSAPA